MIGQRNVTSRVEKCPAHWRPCFSPIWTIFELVREINKTYVLSKFHDDWAKIVTTSVFTRKTAPPTGGHIFQWTRTTFELNQHIIKTDILTNFQLHRDIIGTNLLTKKTGLPTGGNTNILTNFELDRDIIGKKLLTKFHEDRKRNVPSRKYTLVSSPVFELNSHIKETNVLTKFHENWAKNVTSRLFISIFEFVREINKTHVLTNFHDDWAKIVTSRVFTRKTAPPTGGHVFQQTRTTFELSQHIIKTNILTNFKLDRDFIGTKLLTKFHEDRTKNVASRVFTYKCGQTDGRTDDGQRPDDDYIDNTNDNIEFDTQSKKDNENKLKCYSQEPDTCEMSSEIDSFK
ncbi:hypothetical protein DPMN_174397 [Dreissena polymorpha]|uniref:Uncharacterized protein n=1 Tax=Dreissena polymorpha TaxID=45954 RepID=A0A9D4E4N0_DREPO|nr:hypothetical protein DPMN_174397 [Dreissena polymorpha]